MTVYMILRALALIMLVAGCQQPRREPPPAPDPLSAELRADPDRDLRGVIVLVDGKVVREEYFNGAGPDELHDIRSAGKSWSASRSIAG